MKILEVIILLLVVFILGIYEFSNLKLALITTMKLGNRYAGLLSILTSLILAYATWKYVKMGEKTLNFMKESFEKEYEEDIKFMFIERKRDEVKEEFIENEDLLVGEFDNDKQFMSVAPDETYLYINLFNSGRRLISHIQLNYEVNIINPRTESVYNTYQFKVVIPATIQPNDYISYPLVYIREFPEVEIIIKSLRSFNGLGKEQLFNSPKKSLKYKNKNLISP
ncbi:hypothetical protein [Candidatus Frackibacter sp. WG13]|uniref:hypothetical protein n=1 Tax=Candidatus Frackibacter sp. WG13 TaxID=2017978 RepID=UPI0008E323AB|nr:hypothetical protein [Candidatus Frackibacter sp. WG13]SFL33601.1 hypothetical protein SAMN04488699_10171 [Candidatus Frackibacter sp. WG13]